MFVVVIVIFVVFSVEIFQFKLYSFLYMSAGDPSGFRCVVVCMLLLLLPSTNLYTSFQELENIVMLQYSLCVCMCVCLSGVCM